MAATEKVEERVGQLERTLSARIARLEEQVAQLQQRVDGVPPPDEPAWWKQIVGVYRDDPEFEEAMRLGREYRESLRPQEDETDAGSTFCGRRTYVSARWI